MAGRKRLPDEVKVARGTFRRDRARQAPSVPMTEKPKPPASLKKVGRSKWLELVEWLDEVKLLERRFMDAMELYCRAWDRLADYEHEAKGKEFQVVDSGYVCAHPALTLAKQARDEIRWFQTEFGFTGASASKVGTRQSAKKAGVPVRIAGKAAKGA